MVWFDYIQPCLPQGLKRLYMAGSRMVLASCIRSLMIVVPESAVYECFTPQALHIFRCYFIFAAAENRRAED
jgi:hypothetical protein